MRLTSISESQLSDMTSSDVFRFIFFERLDFFLCLPVRDASWTIPISSEEGSIHSEGLSCRPEGFLFRFRGNRRRVELGVLGLGNVGWGGSVRLGGGEHIGGDWTVAVKFFKL